MRDKVGGCQGTLCAHFAHTPVCTHSVCTPPCAHIPVCTSPCAHSRVHTLCTPCTHFAHTLRASLCARTPRVHTPVCTPRPCSTPPRVHTPGVLLLLLLPGTTSYYAPTAAAVAAAAFSELSEQRWSECPAPCKLERRADASTTAVPGEPLWEIILVTRLRPHFQSTSTDEGSNSQLAKQCAIASSRLANPAGAVPKPNHEPPSLCNASSLPHTTIGPQLCRSENE